ncbi:MAG: FAD-dependent oxidoreductase [Rhodobacteraceae bacterium]|nr:FAD-dependent oxidoreductase [Paracoccaceae bacterium]
MEIADLVVIGAGLAGLTVARGAVEAGLSVQVLDKGRGIGGRLATRRAEGGLSFDHGAQYLRPRAPGFAALLEDLAGAGAAAPWDAADGAYVGVPGMSGLPKHLARDLDITTGRRAGGLIRSGDVWDVFDTEGRLALRGRRIVMAMPAPQVEMVLGPDHPDSRAIAEVAFAPCWALMAAFDGDARLPETHRDRAPDAVLSWIAHDGAKPGRDGGASYVAHASTAWTRAHLEQDADWVQARLLDALADIANGALPPLRHAAVHRWRFSTAVRPLGRDCVALEDDALFLCGDWCLGDRAEHAWASGQAVLKALDLVKNRQREIGG